MFLEWLVFCLQFSPKTVKIYSKTNTNLFCAESLAKKDFWNLLKALHEIRLRSCLKK